MLKRNMYSMKQYAYYFAMPAYTFEKACNAAYADMSRHALRISNKKFKREKKSGMTAVSVFCTKTIQFD